MFKKKNSRAERELKRPANHIAAEAHTILWKHLPSDINARYQNRTAALPNAYMYLWAVVAHDDRGQLDAKATARVMEIHARMSDEEWADYSLRWRDPEAWGDAVVSNKLRSAGIDPADFPDSESRAKKVFEIAMDMLRGDSK